jgi:hypothetical protein
MHQTRKRHHHSSSYRRHQLQQTQHRKPILEAMSPCPYKIIQAAITEPTHFMCRNTIMMMGSLPQTLKPTVTCSSCGALQSGRIPFLKLVSPSSSQETTANTHHHRENIQPTLEAEAPALGGPAQKMTFFQVAQK